MIDRRLFMLASLAAAAWGVGGCAGSRADSQAPTNPTSALGKEFSTISKRIRRHVADKSRQAPLEALADQALAELLTINRILSRWRYDVIQLPPEQRQDRALVLERTRDCNAKLCAAIVAACDRAVEARALMTEAEWSLVFPGPEVAA